MKGFKLFKKREGNSRAMDKEDFLMKQIDEFKEKAKQLQGILSTRESRVQELQELVSEREEKARELETVLESRQEEADGIMGDVKKQIDSMVVTINKETERLGETVSQGVSTGIQECIEKIDEMKNTLDELNENLTGTKRDISEKIHSENVKCYRNMQALIIEMNKKLVMDEKYQQDTKKMQSFIQCIACFSIVNFIAIVAFILFQTGVFH
ncbi:MAG: hypothetical protein RR364_01235 [Lachnospiraceae bacterium]